MNVKSVLRAEERVVSRSHQMEAVKRHNQKPTKKTAAAVYGS